MRHLRTLTPPQADATSVAVEAVAVTWRGWRQKGQGKQKGWSLVWRRKSLEQEEVGRSDDREAGTRSSGLSWLIRSKCDPGAILQGFGGLEQALLSHTPTTKRSIVVDIHVSEYAGTSWGISFRLMKINLMNVHDIYRPFQDRLV